MIVAQRRAALATPWLYALSLLAGLVIWELIARQLPNIILPPPSKVIVRLVVDLANGSLLIALGNSLIALVYGFILTIVVGIPLGFAMGRSQALYEMCNPVINAVYAIPPVAFVPFLIIWFGLHTEARVALIFLMSVFEVTIVVMTGAHDINPTLLDVGRAFGANGFALMRRVVVPACAPFIFTALRVGLVRGLNAMITAELFFAAVNLGEIMNDASRRFDTAGLLVVIVLLAVVGLLFQEILKLIEGRALPWYLRSA